MDLSDIAWVFPLISRDSKFYKLIVHNLVLKMRDDEFASAELDEADLPKEVLVDAFTNCASLSQECNMFSCFTSVCHYHHHEGPDVMSEADCIRRIEAGHNIYDSNVGGLKQRAWSWN
jgi:hypothetical protein